MSPPPTLLPLDGGGLFASKVQKANDCTPEMRYRPVHAGPPFLPPYGTYCLPLIISGVDVVLHEPLDDGSKAVAGFGSSAEK